MNNFSIELAQQLVNSTAQFPVCFDKLWQWVGYSRKDHAKETLVKHFEINADYQLHQSRELRPQGGYSNREIIKLTVDAAKEFALLAQTENGRKVRWYFIECEKELKRRQVPKISKALRASREVKEIHENIEYISPRLSQYLIDHAVSECLEQALPSSAEPKLRGVVEIAEDMKLPVNMKNRSSLGKFVKKLLPELAREEERLVNGTMRKVKCYPDTPEVREAIQQFFS